ncbi:hypothetical protein B0H21DRAFT_272251 [Amylocystis lapponica]|nr:hypothetical protein B0H21DRAFT_272251 [Amylocystis lapponica]
MSNPVLRVDTSYLSSGAPHEYSYDAPPSPKSPTTPSGRSRARSVSQAILPAFRISSVQNEEPGSSNIPTLAPSSGINKARNESRKLLAHLLAQLQGRPKPPSMLDLLVRGTDTRPKDTGVAVQSVRTAAKHKRGMLSEAATHKLAPSEDTDSEWEDNSDFSTDVTFDLMAQLKDVLLISVAQKWDIFYDSSLDPEAKGEQGKLSDSRRSKRNGQGFRRRSRSRRSHSESLSSTPEPEGASQLLSQCISILHSVITEDCRHRISSPRPSRPPHGLQSVTLDVAQFLLHTHRHNPQVLSQIALAVIPAFYTFRPVMHTRLLAFFDDGIIGNIMDDLQRIQGNSEAVQQDRSPDVSYSDAASTKPFVSILVDEVEDANEPVPNSAQWHRWSTSSRPANKLLRSTNAPSQDISVYQLSSLIPPLLAAMLENVDLHSHSLPTLHRFHRLVSRIIDTKPDAYSDVLAVIAYHTAKARYSAVGLLMSYWPRAVGHLVVSKAFPVLDYSASLARVKQGPAPARRPQDHTHSHQFVPWRFGLQGMPSIFEGASQDECRSCSHSIGGFGLLCPFCMCAVHFDCYDYPEGSFHTQYSSAAEPDMQRIAVFRFSHVIPHRREVLPGSIYKEQHTFRPVNLFTLTLCFICHEPLWGCVMQALKCGACRQFVHLSCLTNASEDDLPRCRSVTIDDSYMAMEWSALRQSFLDHFNDFVLTEAELQGKTYEELSVFFAVLWSQLQILNNGIALGSIVVTTAGSTSWNSDENELEEFELHQLVSLCDAHVSSGKPPISDALAEQLSENRLRAVDTRIFFSWSTLTFIASVIKMPVGSSSTSDSSTGMLNVAQPDSFNGPEDEGDSYPYEVVPLAHLRDQLGDQFQLFSEVAARHALTYLAHLGFFQPVHPQWSLFDDIPNPETQPCYFPLPVGLEVSTEVETLVSAIETCLSDLDLSINETGLLLLVRRFWPDGMLTDYALRRLAKALLSWTWSEDNNLAIMLRDFVAQGRSLPGVRAALEGQPWPAGAQARPVLASSTNNGGDYIAGRRDLLVRHVARWMLALHDRDIEAYAPMLFDLLVEIAEEGLYTDDYFLGKGTDEAQARRQHAIADKTLRLILKLSQASLVFTAFDGLFNLWLARANDLSLDQQPLQSLARLFNREVETSQRLNSIVDSRMTIMDANNIATTSALRVLVDTATGSREGFEQTLHWLCLFVRSGVDISVPTFAQFTSLSKRFNATLDESILLIKAALWSTWLKSMGRQELQAVVVAKIHTRLASQVVSALRSRLNLAKNLAFIRQSLAICLLLYGCQRDHAIELGMIQQQEITGLPSRRKTHARATTVTDPIIVSSSLMEALKSYVETEVEEVSCLAAKFLNAFVNDAAFVESYEVDNFILRNGSTLCTCMWQFYAIQLPEISTMRTALLLRILAVDAQPFQALLHELFEVKDDWDVRLQAVLRLFRIILDVTSPAFNVEDRQWRSSVIDVFYYFFSCLWTDEREEIRLTVDTWSSTLLPAHFDAIALCWNEALAKSPISERVKLVSFLTQLRSHFPTWRVLSWNCMIETLIENDFDRKNGDDEDGPAAAHLSMYGLSSMATTARDVDPDLGLLQVSLLSLSLRMVSDGIHVDTPSLLKIKDQVVRVLGFQDVSLVPAPNGYSFYVRFGSLDEIPESSDACICDLMYVLDSSQTHDVAPSNIGGPSVHDETTCSLLVGSIFVDVLLELFINAEDIASLPFITVKNMLKSLIIVIYKHDFETKPLRHLQGNLRRAVRRTLDLLLMNLSYELRQLALSACQAFIRRWPTIIGNFICDVIESTAQLMVDLDYEQNGEDILVDQTRLFLDSTLTLYSSSGVLFVLYKRHLPSTFFDVIRYIAVANAKANKSSTPQVDLRDALLRDTLTRAIENDPDSYQLVIENLRSFVETVHHTGYSADLMQFVGLSLTYIARRTADWPADAFDPSPLLLLACTLIQHNKAQSRDLLMFMETLLRAALVRFHVSGESLTRVLQITSTLYRKAAAATAPGAEAPQTNPISLVMFEMLGDGLRGKARISAATISALVEAVASVLSRSGRSAILTDEWLAHLADNGLFFLYSEGGSEGIVQSDFTASHEVAKFVLQASEILPGVLGRLTKAHAAVRTWNALALGALVHKNSAQAALLFDYFPLFSQTYHISLSHYQHLQPPIELDAQSTAHTDLSSAYAAIKLWLLLAQRSAVRQREISENRGEGDSNANVLQNGEIFSARMVWNELWPPFESVMSAFEADALAGHVAPLASTVWASVADLFLYLRQSRSVALEPSTEARILSRLRALIRGGKKLSRVTRSVTEPPPDVPLDFFVNQVKTEIQAEEKLYAAAKRQESLPERSRRIAS